MELLSVVIPVYNVEKYLPRCIESLMAQTYKNAEFIFVNDCSPGNAEEIIKDYAKKDERIKYVTYDKNRGLFRARVAGAQTARGEYIAFLDSDDYVTADYYRTLIESLKKYNSDIAVGRTVFQSADGVRYVRNLHDECFEFDVIRGGAVRDAYFSQKGACFSWHTVWNKVYRKKLWDKCFPYYKRIDTHLIMTEDIAFSSLLFYYAQSVSTVENDGIFYCENENASTNAAKTTLKRFTKNMADIKLVFDFVNGFLDEVGAEDKIKNWFNETKKYYCRMWRDLADSTFNGEELAAANAVLEDFVPDYKANTEPADHFFASVTTLWNNGLESIKEQIIKSSAKYISFDIFDTLIMRRVYYPNDVFLLMNREFEKLTGANISFDKIRTGAESEARRRFGELHPEYQDITLDEIYDCMADFYGFDSSVTERMKAEEIRLELMLIVQRRAAKELFDTALACGKEVILVSDMYLTEDTILKMLEKAEYSGFKKLYLSSSYRLTKHSGELFKAVLEDLGAKGEDILHIGDTWLNDIVKPKQLGISTVFFPKAVEVMEDKIQGAKTNNCNNIGDLAAGAVCDSSKFMKSIGYRTMRALAAIKYFDNPYRSFNKDSDFNADPYFIGYNALGMHLMGLCRWLAENSQGYDRLYFMARDGYLPMKAYNICAEHEPESGGKFKAAEYIYASRKMLLPEMLADVRDFYDLPVECRNHTPSTILSLLEFCSNDTMPENWDMDRPFADENEFRRFINYYTAHIYSKEKHEAAKLACENYFAVFKDKKAAAFDMGYSGRIQTALSKAAGRGVDVFFVHSDAERSYKMARRGGYKIHSFYDFYPYISGLLREHIFSDTGCSCIGLKMEGGSAVPVFDGIVKQYQDSFVVENMQRGALDFVRDFVCLNEQTGGLLDFKPYEVSMMFEGYLRAAKDIDRSIFKASYFEDLVYGSKDKINIYDFVKSSIMGIPADKGAAAVLNRRDMLEAAVAGHSRPVRAICYILLDRQLFKLYIIDILARKPRLLKTLVKIKHLFTGREK